jgi:hypothetical protein
MGGTCGTLDMRNAYNVLVGRHESERPIGKPGAYGRILLKWILEE